MPSPWPLRLRRALALLSVAAAGWSAAVAATGGFFLRVGPVRLSSRNAGHVLLIAALAALAAAALHWVPRARTTWQAERAWWRGVGGQAGGRLSAATRLLAANPAAVVALAGVTVNVNLWLASPSLWLDEEMIAINIRDRSARQLADALWLGQSAPYGWLLTERAVLMAAGASERALRATPLAFGVATIGVAWWVGRRWLGRIAAAALVLLVVSGEFVAHYNQQLKHYSADVFFALLLPALAVYASEGTDGADRRRRRLIWWTTAALGHWFGNGALFVTPACAVWLVISTFRRDGRRATAAFVAAGAVWLVSFGAHYTLALRHTHHNRYLREYWAQEVPPAGSGAAATIAWIGERIQPLGGNPGATTLPLLLWGCAAAGFVAARPRGFRGILPLVPLSAFVLAALRLVPLWQRFSLWIVPALYLGVALLIDRAVSSVANAPRRRWWQIALAVAALAASGALCRDIVRMGSDDVFVATPRNVHRLDDRAGVRWLASHRQPGDALLTTRLGWPAVWWYGGIPLRDPAAITGRQPEGGGFYAIEYRERRGDCEGEGPAVVLKDHARALVYLGFRDAPGGFENLLLDELARAGAITHYEQFTDLSLAVIVDGRVHDPSSLRLVEKKRQGPPDPRYPPGCVAVRGVRRW